jgi:hypothetical protein
MITRLFRRGWTHVLIAFNEKYTLEGFERTERKFECPENSNLLDSRSKRELTICNLFANQNQSLWNIVRVLDASMGKVVVTLIEHGLVKERRVREARTKYEKRQKPLYIQPMQQTRASEVPAQFELPFSMSTWVTTGVLKSGSPVAQGSMTARRLAS